MSCLSCDGSNLILIFFGNFKALNCRAFKRYCSIFRVFLAGYVAMISWMSVLFSNLTPKNSNLSFLMFAKNGTGEKIVFSISGNKKNGVHTQPVFE